LAFSSRCLLCRFEGGSRLGMLAKVERLLCGWIGTNLCHGMNMLDPTNRAFAVHRILEITTLLFAFLSFCYKLLCHYPPPWTRGASMHNLWHHPMDVLLSVFAYPSSSFSSSSSSSFSIFSSLVAHLYSYNVFVYPSLVSLENLLLPTWNINRHFQHRSRFFHLLLLNNDDDNDAALSFYQASAMLVIGFGTISNMAASIVFAVGGKSNQRRVITRNGQLRHEPWGISGMHGSVAAALGYMTAANTNRIIVAVSWLDVGMTSSDVLLAGTVMGALSCASVNVWFWAWGWDGPCLVSWVCGGLMGNAFGHALRKRRDGFFDLGSWWTPFF